jgi:hypothetical protein
MRVICLFYFAFLLRLIEINIDVHNKTSAINRDNVPANDALPAKNRKRQQTRINIPKIRIIFGANFIVFCFE